MKELNNAMLKPRTKSVELLLILVAVTVFFSLLFAIQYYAGGPIRLAVTNEINDLTLREEDSLLIIGTKDGTIQLYDLERNWSEQRFSGHKAAVIGVFLDPSGNTLYSVGINGRVLEWDITTGEFSQIAQLGSSLNGVAFAKDRLELALVEEGGAIQLLDLISGEIEQIVNQDGNSTLSVAISQDGLLLAAGQGDRINVWDIPSGKLIQTMEAHCDEDAYTTREACEDANQDWMGHDDSVTALAFSPDAQIIASGSADTTIAFWDLATGKVRWSSEGHWATVTKLVFNDEGDALLSAGKDSKARTLRVQGGKTTATFEGHLNTVNGIAFGADQSTIFTGSSDGTVRQWESANQRILHTQWANIGYQPVWGKTLSAWFLISGILGSFALWGLWRYSTWGHLLTLSLFLFGSLIVIGLPLLEVLAYHVTTAEKIGMSWPLVFLALWYVFLVRHTLSENVAVFYEAPRQASLSDQLLASLRAKKARFGIMSIGMWILVLVVLFSVLRRFNLDVAFMGHFFSFIMQGSWMTLRISALSIALAVVLALLGAVGRLSRNAATNGVASFYVSLVRGTPLLVQIYIWYLGLPRLDVVLPAQLAGILALGVNYGAYMTETFRAGIQAIGKGQHEAAQALGMTRSQTLRRIVLPQAFRIVIPPIGNDFIAMMKDSSLVSVMAIWELTYRAQKIGRQNFRNMETFIIAAAFYWLLTVVFQFLQGKLEDYMARSERK